jgi:hypothetical protein
VPITFTSTPSTRGIQAITQDMAEGTGAGSALANHPTQSATTIDGWGSVLFGLPFLLAGLGIGAAALQLFPVHGKHAPNSAIGIIGGMFGLAGLFLFMHGVHGIVRKIAYKRESERRPGDIWYADYHWHQEGASYSALREMASRFLAAVAWNGFLVPFFWVGFTQRGAWLFAVVASLFGLIGIIFWVRWAQMLGEVVRYGNSSLIYDQFPYFLGGTLGARLRLPRHVADLDELKLTLRCVMERYVITGTGNNRSSKVVCYELYQDSKTFSQEQVAGYAGGELPLQFKLPDNQPSTTLIATPPTYWEIEAAGSSHKVNYQAYFKVPVYKSR